MMQANTTPPSSMAFTIENKAWTNLDIIYANPNVMIEGSLEGLDGGDSNGKSSKPAISKGLVFAENVLNLPASAGGGSAEPSLKDFVVLRRDDKGDYQNISPEQMAQTIRKSSIKHRLRLENIESLIDTLKSAGGDNPGSYHGQRFVASFKQQGVAGNILSLIDKKKGLWLGVNYHDLNSQDILKIGIAKVSISDMTLSGLEGENNDFRRINELQIPVITYVTSEGRGLDLVSYLPSVIDAANLANNFGLPEPRPEHPRFSVWVHDDDRPEAGNMVQTFSKEAAVGNHLESDVIVGRHDNNKTIELGDLKAELADIDELLDKTLRLLKKELGH